MQAATSHEAQVRKAALSSWIGSALEYYDFFLYSTAAALFLGPLYFPASEPGLTTLGVLASVGAGYIMRPVGALYLGHLGDIRGRRFVLCLSFSLMGTSSFLIGLLPTYQDIGIAAPMLLILLRLLQGFAISGEQSGASALMLELSGNNRRGLYSSFTLSGTQVGHILSSVAFMLVTYYLTETGTLKWAWRIPFLLSIFLVGFGLWARKGIPESPVFLSVSGPPETKQQTPLRILWKEYKADILRVILAAQISAASTIVGVFSLLWAVNHTQISRSTMLALLLVSTAIGMLTIPVWASLSDRIGRKPVFVFGALGSAVLIWPYFMALGQSDAWLTFLAGSVLLGVVYSAANGVWPSLYGEMFSARVRLSGMAISTQIGFVLAGQAPALAAFFGNESATGWNSAAWIVSLCCAVSAVTVCFARETSRECITELGRKTPDTR